MPEPLSAEIKRAQLLKAPDQECKLRLEGCTPIALVKRA